MNLKTKRDIRNKARLISGLVNILAYDTSNLLNDSNECNSDTLLETIQDTKETLQNVADTLAEIEYILFLNKFKGS